MNDMRHTALPALTPRRRVVRSGAIGIPLLLVALLPACNSGPTPAPPTPAPAQNVEVRQDTPENAARAALQAIQQALRVRHAGDAAAYKTNLEKLRLVAAERDIVQRFEKAPQYRALLEGEDVVEGVLENWMSAVAYYVQGADFERMRTAPLSQTQARGEPTVMLVRVFSKGRDDDAWIQLRCVQGGDGLWRVSLINFYVPKAGDPESSARDAPPTSRPSSPASAPSTAPADAPTGR